MSPCLMPRREAVDRRLRLRVAGWVRYQMAHLNIRTQAEVARRCKVDPGFVSKLLSDPLTASLGLDNAVRLIDGLGLNAQEVIYSPPPKVPLQTTTKVFGERPDGSESGR